jgi:hypothetical protein
LKTPRATPVSLPRCSSCVLCELIAARREWLVESSAASAQPALRHHGCLPADGHADGILGQVADALLIACTAYPANGGATPDPALLFLRARGYDVAHAVGRTGGERDSVAIAAEALERTLLGVLSSAVDRERRLSSCERHIREMLAAVCRGAEERSSERPGAHRSGDHTAATEHRAPQSPGQRQFM